ncbi:MAG: hypothetical protein JXB50_10585 [Spirochaetes bacterium]|nr:hypothetical protein [Spirochaetota bacterium]
MIKKTSMVIIFLIAISFFISSQSGDQDTYSTMNIMIGKIYFTTYGLIVEYSSGGKIREAYLPNKFFNEGIAIKIPDDNSNTTPQMNIIFKNKEQLKVKIYMPTLPIGYKYPLLEYVSKEIIDNFNKQEKLNIVLFDSSNQK